MPDSRPTGTSDPLFKWLLGFFGALAGILLLPRTIKYMIRRFLFGLVGEVVAVVVTGLLTEKLVGWVSQNHQDSAELPQRERQADAQRS